MNNTSDGALTVPGQTLSHTTLAPGGHWTAVLPADARLRIIDLEGRQAVDFLCFDNHDRHNRYNAANTIKFAGNLYIGQGTVLYSDLATPLMTVITDTCGHHDTVGGCCSAESNRHRYGKLDTPNCRDNFLAALDEHGMDARDLVANVNFFMNVPVAADGTTAIRDGLSKPGDYVDLRADTEVLVLISNCPQVDNPCNGYNPTPIALLVWEP